MKRSQWFGLAPVILVLLISTVIPALSSESPDRMYLERSWAPPSYQLPLGAGEAGINLLVALTTSTQRALGLSAVVALIGFCLGVPLGAAAALAGARSSQWLSRVCDFVQSFPTFLLALAVLSVVKAPSRLHIGAVFCVAAWAPFARISLLQAQVLVGQQFTEAARSLGASTPRILFVHILPNLLGPTAVQLGSSAAATVLGEAALGFIGLGPRDGVSLGALLEQGTLGMLRAPHALLSAACTVAIVSISLQLASEVLRARFSGVDG